MRIRSQLLFFRIELSSDRAATGKTYLSVLAVADQEKVIPSSSQLCYVDACQIAAASRGHIELDM